MITVEEQLIDTITATVHYLRTGDVPPPIPIPDDLPDNEIRQLIVYVNRFLTEFAPFVEAMKQISEGELDAPSPWAECPWCNPSRPSGRTFVI